MALGLVHSTKHGWSLDGGRRTRADPGMATALEEPNGDETGESGS